MAARDVVPLPEHKSELKKAWGLGILHLMGLWSANVDACFEGDRALSPHSA
jgi:hypothetical protein